MDSLEKEEADFRKKKALDVDGIRGWIGDHSSAGLALSSIRYTHTNTKKIPKFKIPKKKVYQGVKMLGYVSDDTCGFIFLKPYGMNNYFHNIPQLTLRVANLLPPCKRQLGKL